jgi:hypothetical protein
MNDAVTVLQAQTEGLLRRVAREQESRTLAIHGAAEEQARSIVLRARQEARARLRQAVEEERRQFERAVGERRAALDTAARRAEQATLRVLIEQAWRRLPQAIAALWSDPVARERWIEAACECAARSLRPQASYVVEFDADAAPGAGPAASGCLVRAGLEPVECVPVAGLGAGLRIRGGGACIDATVPGLLASRERVEAELLAEFDRLLEEAGRGAGQ